MRRPVWRYMLGALAIGWASFASFEPAYAGIGEASDIHVSWWRVIAGFLVCVVIAVSIIYGLKLRQNGVIGGRGPGAWLRSLSGPASLLNLPSRRLKLVETLRLTHQVDICLIHYDDTELAIAASPQGGALVFMRPKPATRHGGGTIVEETLA